MLREAQLKPAYATAYPMVTPGRWYTAAALAGQLTAARIVHDGAAVRFTERVLHPAHFEFRGSGPRTGSWVGLRTRREDRHVQRGPAHRRSLALLHSA
ncbi:MAG: hypothetical protein IPI38_07525 [Gemmatimonadetes bacterium]|nr:hypothetical protein [Gemmatimonadota bacterium]MBK6780538.1 hypothetical protein [Gemmatimonadota bacterium]MBK7715258.1 hypothetical protein [Gemmatimonadota bacterium]MBK7786443.1 hypothetical protein [Gemmatimonadota bacterium]MBK7922803.1 hypothetical protein [Gemmatimonadota bacterium]